VAQEPPLEDREEQLDLVVLAIHPDRVNPGVLWTSATALKP
jgi:hypothetical protein